MSEQSIAITPGDSIHVKTSSGAISVHAEHRDDVLILDGDASRDSSGRVQIHGRRLGAKGVEVRCPTGTSVSVGTASGRVELSGVFGHVNVTSASSPITLDRAQAADLRSASGRIEVGSCERRCRVKTLSGRVTIAHAGRVDIATGSGKVTVLGADGPVNVHSVSGKVDLGCLRAVDAKVKTMSAAVTLRLPKDVRPDAALNATSGKTRCDCLPGSDCHVDVRTVSGRIEVVPA